MGGDYIVGKRKSDPHFPHFLHLGQVQEVREVQVFSAFSYLYARA